MKQQQYVLRQVENMSVGFCTKFTEIRIFTLLLPYISTYMYVCNNIVNMSARYVCKCVTASANI